MLKKMDAFENLKEFACINTNQVYYMDTLLYPSFAVLRQG